MLHQLVEVIIYSFLSGFFVQICGSEVRPPSPLVSILLSWDLHLDSGYTHTHNIQAVHTCVV